MHFAAAGISTQVTAVLFGSPNVGDATFTADYNSRVNTRNVNFFADMVPQVRLLGPQRLLVHVCWQLYSTEASAGSALCLVGTGTVDNRPTQSASSRLAKLATHSTCSHSPVHPPFSQECVLLMPADALRWQHGRVRPEDLRQRAGQRQHHHPEPALRQAGWQHHPHWRPHAPAARGLECPVSLHPGAGLLNTRQLHSTLRSVVPSAIMQLKLLSVGRGQGFAVASSAVFSRTWLCLLPSSACQCQHTA